MKVAFICLLCHTIVGTEYARGEGKADFNLSASIPFGSVDALDLISSSFKVIRWNGERYWPVKAWATTRLKITPKWTEAFELKVFVDWNLTHVYKDAEAERASYFSGLLKNKYHDYRKTILLPTFDETFIGIEASTPYSFALQRTNFDLQRFLVFCVGMLLFLTAGKLSRNQFFYYGSSVSIVVLASVLLAVILILKRVKRPAVVDYALWIFGPVWVLTLWRGWDHLLWICEAYPTYVVGYVTISALVAFAVLYRMGPPRDVRSLQLFKWAVQLVGLGLVGGSVNHAPTAILLCVLLVFFSITSRFWKRPFSWLRYRFFPPTRRLLSLEEYYEEGRIETQRELDSMRSFMLSPDASAESIWRAVGRLSDPKRSALQINFDQERITVAHFMLQGGSHVTAEEEEEHNLSGTRLPPRQPNFSDDDSTESDTESDNGFTVQSPYRSYRQNGQITSQLNRSQNRSIFSSANSHSAERSSRFSRTSYARLRRS